MIVSLTVALLVSCVAALVVLRGRRWELATLMAVPASAQLMVILQAYLHYRHYLAIPGLQGRYVYPTTFGVLLPLALVAVLVLGRWSRWAPTLLCGLGLLVSGWALYTSAEYTWLHRGERLVPSDWSRAFNTLAAFFPLDRRVFISLVGIGLILVVASAVLVVAACARCVPSYGWRELRTVEADAPAEPAGAAAEPAAVG
jgi:hypothetical protein